MVDILSSNLASRCPDLECDLVYFQFSDEPESIGKPKFGKVLRIARTLFSAVCIRYRRWSKIAYYVPAPPRWIPLFRDWLILPIIRALYPSIILHWHAVGLGQLYLRWKEAGLRGTIARALCDACYGRAHLSIALSHRTGPDAATFAPKTIAIIPNGIPDPCPDFLARLLPQREMRVERRRHALRNEEGAEETTLNCLFMSACTEAKGLFDTIRGLESAAQSLAQECTRMRVALKIAGTFHSRSERSELDELLSHCHWADMEYLGFADAELKDCLLSESDCLFLPTYYRHEASPLVIIEALAYGLPVVATAWRGIPEILPPLYPLFVPPHCPLSIAQQVKAVAEWSRFGSLRQRYSELFSELAFVDAFLRALRCLTDLGEDYAI